MSAGEGSDFSTNAELSLSLPDRELSAIRSQIENELADIPIGVDASGVGGGGRMQPRDPSTGRFMSIEGVEQRVIEQTEAQVELLDDIKDAVEGRGGGGGIGLGGAAIAGRAGGAAGGGFFGGLAGGALARLALFGGSRGVVPVGQGGVQQPGQAASPEAARQSLGPALSLINDEMGGAVSDALSQEPTWVSEFNPQLDVPDGIPPTLDVPPGIPPELEIPLGLEWPPELEIPQAPRWAQELIDLFGGGGGDRAFTTRREEFGGVGSVTQDNTFEQIIEFDAGDIGRQVDDLRDEWENFQRRVERALR